MLEVSEEWLWICADPFLMAIAFDRHGQLADLTPRP
jgi:hypothetical protein